MRATRTRASGRRRCQADAETLDGASDAPGRRACATLLSTLCFRDARRPRMRRWSRPIPATAACWPQAPKTVQLRFNEAVTPAVIELIDAAGRARDDATVRADGETIVITLPEDLPRGTQVVSYRVISADGHPVGGSMVFSIGAVTGTPAMPKDEGSADGLIWLARIGVYFGLFVGVGGVFFRCLDRAGMRRLERDPSRRLIRRPGQRGGLVGLQGLDLLDLPLKAHRDRRHRGRRAATTSLGTVVADRDRGDGGRPRGSARRLGAFRRLRCRPWRWPASACRWQRADTLRRRRRNG